MNFILPLALIKAIENIKIKAILITNIDPPAINPILIKLNIFATFAGGSAEIILFCENALDK